MTLHHNLKIMLLFKNNYDIMDSLTSMKQFITQVQGKVRGLDKLIKKEQKNTVKMSEKKNRGNRKPSGFAKPGPVSDNFVFL